MKRKLLAGLMAGTLSMMALTGCGGGTDASTNAAADAGAESAGNTETGAASAGEVSADRSDQLYIFINANTGTEYCSMDEEGIKEAGEFLGVQTEYVGPVDYNMDQLISDFETSIAKNPDGIIVIGWEDSMIPTIDKAVDTGIPVVCIDADLPDSKRLMFVGTGNVEAGKMCGREMAELIGGKGKVAILGKSTLSNILERVEGCEQVWAEDYPNIEYIGLVDSGSESSIAAANIAATMQAHPDLAGICSVDSEAGAGAIMAIREAGKAGEIKCVAFDRGSEILSAIEEGIITESIVQQTELMPFYALQVLYNYKNANVTQTADDQAAGMPGVPISIDTGTTVCTQENVELFKVQ